MLKPIFIFFLAFIDVYAGGFDSSAPIDLLFFGAFAMIIIYNLGYLVVLNSAAYASYFMFHLTLFIVMLFYTGMLKNPWFELNLYGVPVGMFFLSAAMLLAFSRDFLDVKLLYPKATRVFNTLIILNLGLVLFSAFAYSNTFFEILSISLVLLEAVGLLLFSASAGFSRSNIYARFYFLSFSFLFVTLGAAFLGYFCLTDIGHNTPHLFELGILLEAGGLSFALAYQQKESEVSLKQNEMLFQELSHRVQNNLQQIISILTLQISNTADTNVKTHLEETIGRIGSISLIHKTLQRALPLGKVKVHTYLNALIDGYQGLNSDVAIAFECPEELELPLEKLTPLALIINELITNSVKHAFKDKENPHIHIKLEKNSLIHFTYEDNGPGFQEEAITPSTGSKLIKILSTSQLKGQTSIDSDKRYFFSLQFSQ